MSSKPQNLTTPAGGCPKEMVAALLRQFEYPLL